MFGMHKYFDTFCLWFERCFPALYQCNEFRPFQFMLMIIFCVVSLHRFSRLEEDSAPHYLNAFPISEICSLVVIVGSCLSCYFFVNLLTLDNHLKSPSFLFLVVECRVARIFVLYAVLLICLYFLFLPMTLTIYVNFWTCLL